MTKEEFAQLEKICKDEWKELAKSGSNEKAKKLNKFTCSCPACEFTVRLRKGGLISCEYCPVTLWRESEENFACENGSGLYVLWLWAESSEERKDFAKQISELEWSWIPEYENLQVEDLLID